MILDFLCTLERKNQLMAILLGIAIILIVITTGVLYAHFALKLIDIAAKLFGYHL